MNYTYEYPRPMVTVDVVLFYRPGNFSECEVLLIKRGNDPYKDCWALPGGFIEMEENIKSSAIRELEEETGIIGIDIHPFGVFSKPGRDPRGRTITVSYVAETKDKLLPEAGDDAADAQWFALSSLPSLAFDHNKMIAAAFQAFDKKKFLFSDE